MDRKLYISSDYFHFVADQSEMGLFISELRIQQVFFYFHRFSSSIHSLFKVSGTLSPQRFLPPTNSHFSERGPPGSLLATRNSPFFSATPLVVILSSITHPYNNTKEGKAKWTMATIMLIQPKVTFLPSFEKFIYSLSFFISSLP